MARTSFNLAPQWTTDAAFRAFGTALSNALVAIGLVKVSHANDINWATATKPATAWTNTPGFEVYRLNDSLQNTAPIFFSIFYGVGSDNSTPYVVIYSYFYDILAIPTGGPGAATGTALFNQSSSDSTARTTYLSGDGSGFVVHAFEGREGWGAATIVLERTRDNAGAIDSRGIQVMLLGGNGSSSNSRYSPRLAGGVVGPSTQYAGVYGCPPLTGTGASGGNVALFPIRPISLVESNPSAYVAAYFTADLVNATPVSITRWLGDTKTFLPMASRNPKAPGYTPANSPGVAIYWEP